MMLTASLVTAAFASPSSSVASGDHHDHHHKTLHHQKHRLDKNIHSKTLDLDEISTRLVNAQHRVDGAVSDLDDARAKFEDLKAQAHVAAVHDQEMQHLLEQAEVRLADAEADLTQGTEDVQTERAQLASYAVTSFQTGGSTVLNIGVAFDAQSPQEALDNMQASDTVLDKQAVALQRFEATKVLLTLTEQRVQATKDDVERKREDAAQVLQTKLTLKQQAQDAKEAVKSRLADLRDAKQEIIKAKAREKRHLAKMKHERERVESQLRKIAERRARQHARQLARRHGSFKNDGGGFLSYPVTNTYITSPYGMRLHPILHVWKLHDGTDFHAPCGTPVYAAASGRVLSEYYNAGYGNRIILDHGFVHGVSLQTSYNHLTSFVARVGHFVNRGQLIAYSGTTGYSTACHLHFMVYVNGYTVNPVTWL
jgi:murein DD-endopeptidase MepM/ murein hydrolase activator NlpD